MNLNLARIVVTNSASAIGAATVTELRGAGAEVITADAATDVSTHHGRVRLLESIGPVTHLVIADGPSLASPLSDVDDEHWSAAFDGYARVVFGLCQAFCPRLPPGGAVVMVTSVAGKTGRNPEVTVYSAAQAAVLSLTRSFANTFGKDGVRVNAICTGIIDTPSNTSYLNQVAAARGISTESLAANRLATVPLGRTGTPAECATAIRYLLSPGASFITGQAINVTGGFCNH